MAVRESIGSTREFLNGPPRPHRGSQRLKWVKTGKAQCEQMFSAVHPTTDIAKILRLSVSCQEQTLPGQRTEHLQCDQLLIGPGLCHSRNKYPQLLPFCHGFRALLVP